MSEGFYLKDLSHETPYRQVVVEKDVLHLKLDKNGFDDRADPDNVKQFPALFKAFTKEHPDYRLPKAWAIHEHIVGLNKALDAKPVVKVHVEPEKKHKSEKKHSPEE